MIGYAMGGEYPLISGTGDKLTVHHDADVSWCNARFINDADYIMGALPPRYPVPSTIGEVDPMTIWMEAEIERLQIELLSYEVQGNG